MTNSAPASRNAPCPCGSGRRYKHCHAAPGVPAPAAGNLDVLLPAALAAHRAGRLGEAAQLYEHALALAPDHFDALHMLGVVHFQQGGNVRACELMEKALALRPDINEAKRNLRLARNALRRERAEARYRAWIEAVERPETAARAGLRAAAATAANAPCFSVVMPTYESPAGPLRACLESVLAQDYPHWELCVADDASPSPHVRAVLAEFTARDPRIRVAYRETNGHISAASNTALALAAGDFVALLDHDDLLPAHALGEVALEIAAHPGAAIVYSDEDKIDGTGRRFEAYFKPDWNPMLVTAQNCVSHLGVYRTSLLREVGGFRVGFEGAQDWDLLLRCAERVETFAIRHIPRILYHWRIVEGSTALSMENKDYAAAAQARVVTEAFTRRGLRVNLRRTVRDAFLEANPIVMPAPDVSVLLLGGDEADAARWRVLVGDRLRDLAIIETTPARLDGQPRALGRAAATALNVAATRAGGDVLVVVDARCVPPEPARFAAWIAHATQPAAGPVGALVQDVRGDIAAGAFVLDPTAIAATCWHGEAEGAWGMAGRAALVQNVSAVSIEAMAVRRALWSSLHGLDVLALADRHHDIDFCLRAIVAGYRPVWHPGIVLAHAGTIGEREGEVPDDADAAAMRVRWGDVLAHDPTYNPNLARPPSLFELALPDTVR